MRLRFWDRPNGSGLEARAGVDATDAAVQALVNSASGGVASVNRTAAAVAGVRAIAGAFSVATVAPVGLASVLTAPTLRDMVVSLITWGNAVYEIQFDREGRFRLDRAAAFDVYGGSPDPAEWVYSLELATPRGLTQRRQETAGVVHVKMLAPAAEPWRGRSPLLAAGLTAGTLARIEQSLQYDASTPVAHLLPIPDAATEAQIQELRSNIAEANGRVVTTETTAAGYGQGASAAPRRDLVPQRIGPEPPLTAMTLQQQASASVLLALGILPGMLAPQGQAMREARRQLITDTVADLAQLVQSELSEKLEADIRLDFNAAAGLDTESRARAMSKLVEAGFEFDEAARIAGLRR